MNNESDFRGLVGYAGTIKSNVLVEEYSPPSSPNKTTKIGLVLNGLVGYAGYVTVVPRGIGDIIDFPGSPPSNGEKSLAWDLKEFFESPETIKQRQPSFEEMMSRDIPIPANRPPELTPFCFSSPPLSVNQSLNEDNNGDLNSPFLNEFDRSSEIEKFQKKISRRHLSVTYSEEFAPVIEKAKAVTFSLLGSNEVPSYCESGSKFLPDGVVDEEWTERLNRRRIRLENTRRYRMLESVQDHSIEVLPMAGGLPKMQSIRWSAQESHDHFSLWLKNEPNQDTNFIKSTSLERCRSLSYANTLVTPMPPISTQTVCPSDSTSSGTSLQRNRNISGTLKKRKSLPIQSPNEVKPLVGWGEKTIPQPTYEAQFPMRQSCMSDRHPTIVHNSEEDYGYIFMRLQNLFKEDLIDLLEILMTREDKLSGSLLKSDSYSSSPINVETAGHICMQTISPKRKTEFKSLRSLERPESRVKPVHSLTSKSPNHRDPSHSRMCAEKKVTGHVVYENEQEIALFRVGDVIIATDSKCPHAGGPLEVGDIENLYDGDCVIRCPWHGFKFNLFKSGEIVHPLSRKDNLRLRTYPVKIDETGSIYVGFDSMSQNWFDLSIME